MSSKNEEIYEAIENPVIVDATDEFAYLDDESASLDIIVPERTILKYQNRGLHIYKACYLKRLRANGANSRVVKSSLCLKRSKVIADIIRKSSKIPKSPVLRLLSVFDWLDDNKLGDSIYSDQDALQTYFAFSEYLYREARRSAIRGKGRQRQVLRAFQDSMLLLLSTSSGLSSERLKHSAIRIRSVGAYSNKQKRTASEIEIQNWWNINHRHFDFISSFLLNKEPLPLVIPREDLGLPDYKKWTTALDSTSLEKAKANKSISAMYFDENDDFIFDAETVRVRAKELGQPHYRGHRHRTYIAEIKNLSDDLRVQIFRNVNIHFAHLLLMVSGCNAEQLEYLDFSKKLSSTPNAKRQLAAKPRAGYAPKPVQFSAKFLPIWRKYLKIRQLTLEIYDPGFGDFGIPVPLQRKSKANDGPMLWQATSDTIRIKHPASLGFPNDTKIPLIKSARDYKTSNLLDITGGNIGQVSKQMGRSEGVTRKSYAYKAFEDSAKQLTDFFDALTKAASIKADGYSPTVPIRDSGARIHTGSCDARDEPPRRIQGVTESAPEPRCGAPVTCFFCEHFGHHADVYDVKLMLSAKAWLERQTKEISRNIDEHVLKFLPIIERIDDIVTDFRKQSDEYNSIYESALSDVEAGNYSSYWRNKINAFISALEF